MTKLTLSARPEVVRRVKKLAKEQGTSVSAMFDRFARAVTSANETRPAVGPLTRSLSGILKNVPKNKSDRELLEEAFVDTNVLMDVLLEREPFLTSSIQVWTLCETGTIRGLISVISFNNVFYVVRKYRSKGEAQRSLGVLRDIFTPVALDGQIINQAIDSGFRDFEDAIQYHCALRGSAKFLVTRNVRDHRRDAGGILGLSNR